MSQRDDFENDSLREERDAQEIADQYEHLIEFGRAVKQLRAAANMLERNGHFVPGAYQLAENALENLDTVANEEREAIKHMRREKSDD